MSSPEAIWNVLYIVNGLTKEKQKGLVAKTKMWQRERCSFMCHANHIPGDRCLDGRQVK